MKSFEILSVGQRPATFRNLRRHNDALYKGGPNTVIRVGSSGLLDLFSRLGIVGCHQFIGAMGRVIRHLFDNDVFQGFSLRYERSTGKIIRRARPFEAKRISARRWGPQR